VIGTRQQGDSITFPVEGVDGGSISMLSVRVGESKKRWSACHAFACLLPDFERV